MFNRVVVDTGSRNAHNAIPGNRQITTEHAIELLRSGTPGQFEIISVMNMKEKVPTATQMIDEKLHFTVCERSNPGSYRVLTAHELRDLITDYLDGDPDIHVVRTTAPEKGQDLIGNWDNIYPTSRRADR